jgi:ribosomal protein S18 acetylase RimI-like enzyme
MKKTIDDLIIAAIYDHEGRCFTKPKKLLLGTLEWAELGAYVMEHFGAKLVNTGANWSEFRGCKLYQVDDESYLYCAP